MMKTATCVSINKSSHGKESSMISWELKDDAKDFILQNAVMSSLQGTFSETLVAANLLFLLYDSELSLEKLVKELMKAGFSIRISSYK